MVSQDEKDPEALLAEIERLNVHGAEVSTLLESEAEQFELRRKMLLEIRQLTRAVEDEDTVDAVRRLLSEKVAMYNDKVAERKRAVQRECERDDARAQVAALTKQPYPTALPTYGARSVSFWRVYQGQTVPVVAFDDKGFCIRLPDGTERYVEKSETQQLPHQKSFGANPPPGALARTQATHTAKRAKLQPPPTREVVEAACAFIDYIRSGREEELRLNSTVPFFERETRLKRAVDALRRADKSGPLEGEFLDIVFDGPPSYESGRFVECEIDGYGVRLGGWRKREDGFWVLRLPLASNNKL